jgi:hypothetical protein
MPIIRSQSTEAAASGLPQERGGSSAVRHGRSGCGNKTCKEKELRSNYINIKINGNYRQCNNTMKAAVRFRTPQPDQPWRTALLPPHSYGKPEAATAVDRLLMMGIRMPKIC